MNLDEKSLDLILSQLDIDAATVKSSYIIGDAKLSIPLLNQPKSKELVLRLNLIPDRDDQRDFIMKMLNEGKVANLKLISSNYNECELEQIAMMIRLAS